MLHDLTSMQVKTYKMRDSFSVVTLNRFIETYFITTQTYKFFKKNQTLQILGMSSVLSITDLHLEFEKNNDKITIY